VGCGSGNFFFQHKKLAGKRIGIDFAESQIEYARRSMPDVEWICTNIEKAELPKSDYVVFSEVLEHLSSKTKAIKKIHESLARHGKLIITTQIMQAYGQ
jgi:2-polyprenyl-3-methyl-5-hydroxy-6-metoxy-1,4-benzoquinol methylase